jgi:thiamine transport system substrate-binding protein
MEVVMHHKLKFALAGIAITTLALSGCAGGSDPTVVTIVHNGYLYFPDDVLQAFEEESGLTVEFIAPGDSGPLVNALVLTKDHPLGDVVFGIDTTFASRAIDEGLFEDYTSGAPAATDAAAYGIPGSSALTAIDYGDVCINVDHQWFAEQGTLEPVTLEDLIKPEYRGLLSVISPVEGSATAVAFLLATTVRYGDAWPQYWTALVENDVHIVGSWSEAYDTDFSGSSEGGSYPLVVSYDSSPFGSVGEDGVATTGMLPETCFRVVEYAGVLANAANPEAAHKVIDWMLSDEVQASRPDYMWMYPVSGAVELSEEWAQYAPPSDDWMTLDPATIAANRDEYLRMWVSLFG